MPARRVLLVHPASEPNFWQLPLICRTHGCKAAFPPLGLITLAALLPEDWELRLVDQDVRPLQEADWQWADLVLVSGMLSHRAGLLALVREAKARGRTVVAGGFYPSGLPQEVLDAGADLVVRGEAENTVPLMLGALAGGRRGQVIEHPEKPALTSSAVPRFDLLELSAYKSVALQTSRGCPHDCEFCDVTSLLGRRVRTKEVHQVLAELQFLYRLGWRGSIFFADDNFIGDRAYARELLEELIPWNRSRGEPFSFWSQASLELARHPDLIDLMTAANFDTVFVGIESPDVEVLTRAGKHQNVRHPLVDSLNNITKNGLGVMGSFIVGMDGEEAGAGARITALVEAAALPLVMPNLMVALPRTRLWDRLQREGRLAPVTRTMDALFYWPTFSPARPEREILEEYAQLWEDLFEPSRFLARAGRYFLLMRPTRAALGQEAQTAVNSRPSATRFDWRRRLNELRCLGLLIWRWTWQRRQGRQFFRQLREIRRKNPSRLHKFVAACFFGEEMMGVSEVIRRRVREYLDRS